MYKPVILLAPLDWGLGHTTRCIPIIKHLLSIDCEVVIACNQVQKSILSQEFTAVKFVHLRGYELYFGRNRFSTILKIFCQIPAIVGRIRQEKQWLHDFLRTNHIDAIFSDNRYGMYSRQIPSIFITHQLSIRTPFGITGKRFLAYLNYRLIERFSECWVPDFSGTENLGGELSHPSRLPSLPVKYIGTLSRLYPSPPSGKIKLLILLSGPEPQRSIFEKKLLQQLKGFSEPAVLVRGLPGETGPLPVSQSNLKAYNHLSADKLNRVINDSIFLISRPGYTTIMDVYWLKKKCIFVPTPGQLEQEYLARYLAGKSFCVSYSQNEFWLENAIKEAGALVSPPIGNSENSLYKETISEFITRLPQDL